ncbi:hypothetical protein [Helicobacter sp. 11S02629-2]|uniref:hypothetical protein n=1 Tax=Helicobacter sp. 11S02629-2 TaxID=1476195 RepID=UPI000BA6007A|nr:hypothetical protein [Helicobacter sp. 11S02629-2]PAF42417.1 hypothetical protein BKH40_07875 [Helicobacter sp. 11S02629-2]
MNSSSAASSAVLAGAIGLDTSTAITGTNALTTLSQAVDTNLQNLQDIISSLSPASVDLAKASQDQAGRLQNGYNRFFNALYGNRFSLLGVKAAVPNATNANSIKLTGSAAGAAYRDIEMAKTSIGDAISAYDGLSNKASLFNNVVNGNPSLVAGSTGNVLSNGINSTSQLASTISTLRTNITQLQTALNIYTPIANNPSVMEARSNQLASLNQLNNTLDALQIATNINSANIVSANKSRLQTLGAPSLLGSANSTWSPVAAVGEYMWNVASGGYDESKGNPNQTDSNNGRRFIKDQVADLISMNGSASSSVNPLLQDTQNAAASAKSIQGIINGGGTNTTNASQAVVFDTVKTVVTQNATGTTTVITTYANGDPTKATTQTKIDPNTKLKNPDITASSITKVSYSQVARPLQDSNGNNVKSLTEAMKEVRAANAKLEQAVSAAVLAQNKVVGAAANNASKRNKAPTILPTAKAGIVAFFGKHQSVSVEYQYYFRNTNPNFTSGEVTLNYAYYFGGK